MKIREASSDDIRQMHTFRISVNENKLFNPERVREQDYEEYLTQKGKGWVCENNNVIVGFAIVDLENHNVWALFIRPEFEKQGIGQMLHNTMLEWYFSQTKTAIELGTSLNTRAEIFYRKAGWQEVGMDNDQSEVNFKMTFEDWLKSKIT